MYVCIHGAQALINFQRLDHSFDCLSWQKNFHSYFRMESAQSFADTHRGVGAVTGSSSQSQSTTLGGSSADASTVTRSGTRILRAASPRDRLIMHPDKLKKKVVLPEPAAPRRSHWPVFRFVLRETVRR